MEKPVVSVVIPSYNSEKYIAQTITSVLEQSYEGIIETVVVDDCSKDNTMDIVRSFEGRRDDRPFVCVCKGSNTGVASSRNEGVQICSGEYVCFLDSDDVWDSSKVEKQIALIKEKALAGCEPCIVCTARELIDGEGVSLGKVIHVPEKITYKDMLKTNLIPCSSVMLKKKTALEFPMERDDLVEDYIDWMKIIKQYGSAAGIDEPLLKYRVIQGSRSANKLRAASNHYKALRHIGISAPRAAIGLVSYAVNGIRKFS